MKVSKIFSYEYETQDSLDKNTVKQEFRDGKTIYYKIKRRTHSGYCISELSKSDELYKELSRNDSLNNKINYQTNYLETINKYWDHCKILDDLIMENCKLRTLLPYSYNIVEGKIWINHL